MRHVVSALLLLLATACGVAQTDRDADGPDGLPKVIPYGAEQNQYVNPEPVPSLPPDVEATGGKLRVGGVVYAPPGDSMTPDFLWVVKDGKVWKYSVNRP